MVETNIHNVKSLEVWTNAKHTPKDGGEPYTTTRIWVKTHDGITSESRLIFGVTLFSDGPIEFFREDYGEPVVTEDCRNCAECGMPVERDDSGAFKICCQRSSDDWEMGEANLC